MKNKLYRVEHQCKFKNIDDAVKEANAVAQCANRYIKKHNISCKALICVSEHDISNATPSSKKNGTRGRPIKIFKNKSDSKQSVKKKKPHLHILVKSENANKVAVKLVKNINQRYRKRFPNMSKQVVSRRFPVENARKYIGYVMHQATYSRFVENDVDGLLDNFSFKEEYERYKPNLY